MAEVLLWFVLFFFQKEGGVMKIIGIIPARYESSRLPCKPLADICGKPMIWWVYQQAIKANALSAVYVATDDERIVNACNSLSMPVLLTSKDHDTPTSRLYEVSTQLEADFYLLIMGDEPLVNANCFDLIIPKEKTINYCVRALTTELHSPTEVIDYSNQKVVTNQWGETLLISRSPIPYPKGLLGFVYRKVTGVQIFSKTALQFYNTTSKSILEKAEENDLMRFVENRIPVIMIRSPYKTISVDTPKDLELVRKEIEKRINNNEYQ
ncbi:MAG: 3-deoxy-manno-octulosonate cytidylyltransferase [Tannerellaceae bacterium]|jgi:3-deoxy-manno-octulosonate cytidylyltransferase (CMP-KDO synthetase)|nr:3-deoxy-manno-octulosonate cytidylyltransferase [Tannerellaceae bacterium]